MRYMARNGNLNSLVSPSVSQGACAISPSALAGGRAFYSDRMAGFSLLELMLVLFIMGLLAASAMFMTEGVEEQAKYDETRRRMEMIKRAIVGDPSRTINGGPEISGFAADMGRLPGCVAELVWPGAEKTPATNPKTYDSPCGGSPAPVINAWHMASATGLWAGWRGPYLSLLPDAGDGIKRFRDGYGNAGDDMNFGWDLTGPAGGVISLGSKGANAAESADDIADDALVIQEDYALEFVSAAVRLKIINRSGADLVAPGQNLKLRIYRPEDGEIVASDSDAFDAAAVSGMADGEVGEFTPAYTTTISSVAGVRGYVVLCADDNTLYEGSPCPGSAFTASDVELITITPRAPLPLVLNWIVE